MVMTLSLSSLQAYADRGELYKKYPDLEKLANVRKEMSQRYFGVEQYLDALLLGIFSKEHLYVFGSAGGCKTAACETFLNHADAKTTIRTFNAETRKEEVIGTPIPKDNYEEGKLEYNTNTAIAMYDIGLIDEATLARPEVLTALFYAMNERKVALPKGVVPGIVKSLVFTSNNTQRDVLADFERDNKKKTGKAFFDRILYRVYVPGKESDEENRYQLIEMATGLKEKREDVEKFSLDGLYEALESEFDMFSWSEEIRIGINEITMAFDRSCVAKAREELKKHKEDPEESPYPYTPSSLGSNRDLTKLGKIIRSGVLLSFLKGERETLDVELADLKYLKTVLVPMSPSVERMREIQGLYYEDDEIKTIDDIIFESNEFDRIYEGVLEKQKQTAAEISLNMSEMFPAKEDATDMEE